MNNYINPLYYGQAGQVGYDTTNEQSKSYLRSRIIQIVVDLIAIVLIFVAFIIVYVKLDPKIRGFHCSDTDIFNPNRSNTVPFYAVGLYGTIGPIVVIFIVEALNALKSKFTNRWTVYIVSTLHAISLFVLGIALVLLLTEIGKRWIGRLRPHFIAVCNPDFSQVTCSSNGGGAASNVIYNYIDTSGSFCRGDAADVKEARLSFPSGHSSYSSYTMGFLILYLEARFNSLRFRYVKVLVQLAAFCAAYITSISRIPDYHHRGSDVIGGIVLGLIIAAFIGLVAGRVLWRYGLDKRVYDVTEKEDQQI